MTTDIKTIQDDFAFLDEWEDRYRYIIDLGKPLSVFPEQDRIDRNKVPGCVSQVWLTSRIDNASPPHITFAGQSDAHIVKGLVAVALSLYSGRTAPEILTLDAEVLFGRIGLQDHLTPQRSNGLRSMVRRIQADARAAIEAA